MLVVTSTARLIVDRSAFGQIPRAEKIVEILEVPTLGYRASASLPGRLAVGDAPALVSLQAFELNALAEKRLERIGRTPHLGIPTKNLRVGAEIEVQVYAGQEIPHAGEAVVPLDISVPGGTTSIAVNVYLACSDHFEIIGLSQGEINVFPNSPSSSLAIFRLRVNKKDVPETAIVTAYSG